MFPTIVAKVDTLGWLKLMPASFVSTRAGAKVAAAVKMAAFVLLYRR